nr:uroporphyrinogen-III synthase [Nakamurella flavida]
MHEAGAQVEAVPLISFEPPADPGRLDLAVLDLAAGTWDWVALTSVTAVDAVLSRAAALAVHPLVPADTRVAVVGRSTADAVRAAGLPVDLQPPGAGSAAELARVWPTGDGTVLLPRSALAADDLPEALRGRGWTVTEVDAYRTTVHPVPDRIAADLRSGDLGAVLLTSTSTATALAATPLAAGVIVVAIGAATAQAAVAAGLTVHRIAERPSDTGLLDALLDAVPHRRAPTSSLEPTHPER